MSLEKRLNQPEQLTEKEYRRNILMIGGIEIFLPHSPEEAKICVADEAATTRERQPAMTIREEELEQTLETSHVGEEDENSKEWLNIFIQEAKKTTTLELAEAEEEEADNKRFVDLCEQIEALERRVIV
jgi:hypothetical protein